MKNMDYNGLYSLIKDDGVYSLVVYNWKCWDNRFLSLLKYKVRHLCILEYNLKYKQK